MNTNRKVKSARQWMLDKAQAQLQRNISKGRHSSKVRGMQERVKSLSEERR